MMWVTWRQFRAQAIVAAVVLLLAALAFGLTGLHLRNLYDAAGLPGCHAHLDCARAATKFKDQIGGGTVAMFFAVLAIMYLAPALIGVFWGAPLITREAELGTFKLAWNQSITRRRWLAAKLGIVGLAAMATAGLLSLIVTWWASPLDQVIAISGASSSFGGLARLDPAVFGTRDIAPIGYAVFAVALGVTLGVLIRRTVPAMAATLAAFAAIQLAWPLWIRQHLISPIVQTTAYTSYASLGIGNDGQMTVTGNWHKPGAWVLSNQTVTPNGKLFTGPATQACMGNNLNACTQWLAGKHLHLLVRYEPASRFWAFQWYETVIFLVFAAALAVFCAWWINQRRSA